MSKRLTGKLLSPGFERQLRDGLVRAGSAGKRKRRAAGLGDVGPRVGKVLARITGDDGAEDATARKYSWEEVRPLAAGGVEAKPNGRTGATTGTSYAQEPNGKDVATGDVVELVRAMRDDATLGWVIVGATEGGGVDLQNNGTTAVTAAGAINIPTSSDVLVFGGSGDAGTLSLAAATTAWKVLTWNGSKWVADFVRAHA